MKIEQFRVRDRDVVPPATVEPGVTEWQVLPVSEGSSLTLSLLEVSPGTSATLGTDDSDTVVYVIDGEATLDRAAPVQDRLVRGSAALIIEDERATLTTGSSAVRAVRLVAGAGCDRHASLGARAHLSRPDSSESDHATSNRSFQVLFDMHNGCQRATVFVGRVPPGRSPWHFHQYDEVIWVLSGQGNYHLADGVEELRPGRAFRVHPREVHIVENSGIDDLLELGMFTPAGSPAAAFLAETPTKRKEHDRSGVTASIGKTGS